MIRVLWREGGCKGRRGCEGRLQGEVARGR